MKITNVKIPLSSDVILSALMCDNAYVGSIASPRSSSSLCCPEILLRPHYLGMIDWLIAHMLVLNPQFPSSEVRLISLPQGPNPLITWLVFWG